MNDPSKIYQELLEENALLKQRIKELLESESNYEMLFAGAAEGILIAELQTKKFVYANPAMCRMLGRTEEEISQLGVEDIHPKESLEQVLAMFDALARGEKTWVENVPRLRKDGTLFRANIGASLIVFHGKKCIVGFFTDITEFKQAENAFRESDEKYRTILEQMDDAYFEVDLAGNFTFFNDAITRHVGYSREELIGTSFRAQVAKEDIPILYNAFGKIYTTGKPERNLFYSFMHKDGTMGFVDAAVFPLHNQKGEIVGFRGIAREITKRRQMEESLRQSEEKYRMITENMADLITVTDMNLRFTYISPSIMRTHGYTVEEAMNLTIDQFLTPGSMKILVTLFEEQMKLEAAGAADSERISIVEVEEYKKDGTTVWLECSISAQRDKENKPIGILTVSRDITERKRAEDALRESEEKYRTILEDMDDIYFEVDIKGNITFVNPSSCKKSGYSEEELLGMPFKKISAPDGIEKVMQYFGEIFLTGKTGKPFLWNLVKKNGEQGFFGLVASLIRDKQGNPTGFRGIGRDVTERKRAEEKLQQTLGILRKSIGVTIQVMVSAIEVRDPYTAGHQKRVSDLARSIATEMGLDMDKIEGIRMAGSIHDIGKLAIPSEILTKPTKLSNIEFSLIKEHSQGGYEMLKDVESPWPLAQIVYQHHERIDGSGYPRKLKGDEILIEARIMAVADVVEAMASHRPYRPGLGLEAALEEIEKNKGITYDAAVANACLKLFREKGYQLK